MPKTRQLKHDFFLDEDLAKCGLRARLLFAGLWLLADREGRLEDRPAKIKAQLFPYEDTDIETPLKELDGVFIHRYEVGEKKCIAVVNFKKHQHIHPDEKSSELPAPSKSETGNPRKSPGIMHLASFPSPSTTTTTKQPHGAPAAVDFSEHRLQFRGKDDHYRGVYVINVPVDEAAFLLSKCRLNEKDRAALKWRVSLKREGMTDGQRRAQGVA